MSNGQKRSGRRRRARYTGVLLVALVIVPGLILGWMAIQAADREEAVIEKQLRTALLAEVTPAADRISELLIALRAELEATSPQIPETGNLNGSGGISRRIRLLDSWTEASSLVDIPFVFQRGEAEFLWPREGSRELSDAESEFLDLNLDFFQDRKSVEVLQNLAVQYADRIDSRDDDAPGAETESNAVRRQQALSEFERNEEFRKKLYDEAEKSGKTVPTRSKTSPKDSKSEVTEPASTPSPFVTESLRFSQIIGDNEQGWIPRLVDDQIQLLYWRRLGDERIVGCAVKGMALRERILEVLPTALNQARVLTVLDHTGRPIFDPAPDTPRDWRAPFVTREISEFLPRWEVAAYLTDPAVISDRARTRALTIGLLVGVLVISIMAGGFVVSRTLRSELQLAEQKTTFVANVSHELKTPLTSIRLLSEMLRDGRQKDEARQRKYLDIVVSETERLTRLINNVLDFSRIDREGRQYSRREIDLAGLCREIVDTQMVRLTHSGFTVESSLEADDTWAMVDPEAIKQAVLNLVSNAEKYSAEDKWIRVSLRREGGEAVIAVADHGMGIRPKDAEHIFDEFYRADDTLTANVRGTGLGLTLSRRIIEDHGGRLVYAPNSPRGSVFEVHLPLLESSPSEPES